MWQKKLFRQTSSIKLRQSEDSYEFYAPHCPDWSNYVSINAKLVVTINTVITTEESPSGNRTGFFIAHSSPPHRKYRARQNHPRLTRGTSGQQHKQDSGEIDRTAAGSDLQATDAKQRSPSRCQLNRRPSPYLTTTEAEAETDSIACKH